LLSLAKDKLFIAQLAEIHPKNKTPHKAIIFQTVLTSILVVMGSGSYEVLLSLILPLVLALYSAVMVCLVVLRNTHPDMERTFKAPLGKFLPWVVVGLNMTLILVWLLNVEGSMQIFRIMLSFIFFGIPVYLLLVFFYNPDAIIRMTNYLSEN